MPMFLFLNTANVHNDDDNYSSNAKGIQNQINRMEAYSCMAIFTMQCFKGALGYRKSKQNES